jgi:hypothetical protein
LGALFVVAGALKLRDPTAFATEVANYHLLAGLAPLIAATLPSVEITSGLLLAIGPPALRRASALVATTLMGVFTVAVAQVLVRGINVACGCFGGSSGPVTGWTLLRDLLLLAAGALALTER